MPDLSRNAQLVKFFAQARRDIPRKPLVKYIYVADILGREYLGEPLSSLHYRRDKYGPYDNAIEEAIEELVVRGLAEPRRDPWYSGVVAGAYKRLRDLGYPIAFDFSLGEAAVLDYVVRNYLAMPFDEFMRDIVYETVPMKAQTIRGKPLPMDLVNNRGRERVGFDLEQVLEAEELARRGDNVVTLGDFINELRAKAPA